MWHITHFPCLNSLPSLSLHRPPDGSRVETTSGTATMPATMAAGRAVAATAGWPAATAAMAAMAAMALASQPRWALTCGVCSVGSEVMLAIHGQHPHCGHAPTVLPCLGAAALLGVQRGGTCCCSSWAPGLWPAAVQGSVHVPVVLQSMVDVCSPPSRELCMVLLPRCRCCAEPHLGPFL